ncbi:MAG: hypothetical protein KI792_00280 [Alphaproteobacteria bacterium]|nr:hypothetical protein [Alphaproteobacteria bacterium SS10]
MAKDNFKAAAAKLQQASKLGSLARQVRRRHNPAVRVPMPQEREANSPQQPTPGQSDAGQHHSGVYPPHYQQYQPPPPVRTGFGLGLGFAAGTALFRLIVFVIGMVLLFAFFASIFDAIGF